MAGPNGFERGSVHRVCALPFWKLGIGCLIAVHIALLAYGSCTRFPNVDELAHLPAAIAQWKLNRFDYYRVNPPLVGFVAGFPAWLTGTDYAVDRYLKDVGRRPEFEVGFAKLVEEQLAIQESFVLPRLACSLLSVLGVYVFARWTGNVLGWPSALVACGLWCFSPNILAHGPTLVPDVAAVSLFVIAALAFWSYSLQLSFPAGVRAGVGLGLALATKLTWITGIVSFPFALLLHLLLFRFTTNVGFWAQQFARVVMIVVVAFLVLNCVYLFEDSGQPLGSFEFCSEMLGGEGSNERVHGNRFYNTVLENVPVPVPRNYLLGIDYLRMEVERKAYSFLNGQWKFGSWPHYYVFTTLYKTPEPTLLGALIGLGVLISGIRRRMVRPEVISMFLFLIIPAAVCFASVSLQGGFNHHHRYVLMIYPPMFALVAYIASPVGERLLRFRFPFWGARKRSIAVPLAVALVMLSALSSLRVHPYYTSYFNTLSGGPENGWRLLGFSNIDWGQDILEVDRWLKENPDKRPVVIDLDYFLRGQLFDVGASAAPVLPKGASIDQVRREIDRTQWWIISVTKLYNLPGEPGLEYLQQIEPVERIAYAYHVYRIDPLPK